MSGGALADRAARLAAAVAWLDDPDWARRVAGLAGMAAGVRGDAPPTYGEVAGAGTALVEALARDGRWDDAAAEAQELKRFFGATPDDLGPVAVQAFDGLLAACLARDREELDDFVSLVDEMFG